MFSVISEYSQGKPILVFAATRNLCIKAAGTLVKSYQSAKESGRRLPWSVRSRGTLSCDNKQLDEYSEFGVAFHHGGLSLEDRRKVETSFRAGKIGIIVATSTLAVGVNLPAHTVILAGTYQWSGSGMIPLTDLDVSCSTVYLICCIGQFLDSQCFQVQQMIGRAGRPQYDTEGTAIILCAEKDTAKYRDLINSSTTIESCLHEHLIEHINTEIGLKTITCLQDGQEWIKNSFLYVRIQQNPRHYSGILSSAGPAAYRWEEALTRLVDKALQDLQGRDMVAIQESESSPVPPELRPISATVYGEAMSGNCLSFETMCHILDIPPKASLETLLHALSTAQEYADLKLRNGEKLFYKSLAKDPGMRYSLPNGISPSTSAHKVFILLQMTLGNVDWEPYKDQLKQGSSGPIFDSYQVFRVAPRVCKAMATIALQKEDGETLKNSLNLIRIVSGKAWPGTAVIFRQIDAIGPKSITVLGSKGITTFHKLAKTDPRQIEMLLNRQTGFGNKIVTSAKSFPVFHVSIRQESQVPSNATAPINILFRVEIKVEGNLIESSKKKAASAKTLSVVAVLTDGTYVAYRKASAKTLRPEDLTMVLPARIQYSNQRFQVIVGLDQVSGCSAQAECKPTVPDGVLQSPVTNGSTKVQHDDIEIPRPFASMPDPLENAFGQNEDVDELMEETTGEIRPQVQDLARLPNGNWPCSHNCASKSACKHTCCKEGTKKRPRGLANRALTKQTSIQAVEQQKPKAKLNDIPTKEKDFPIFASPQPKTGRVRKSLPLTQYEQIDLRSASDSDTTEDEKELLNRILKGPRHNGAKSPKRQKIASVDSNDFDDPSFDKAVEHMDLDFELKALSSKGPAARDTAQKRDTVMEPNSRKAGLPSTLSVKSKCAGERVKSRRPQPVKRNRQVLYTSSQSDGTNTPTAVAKTLGKGTGPVFAADLVDDRAPSILSPKQEQPLFAMFDEGMNSFSPGIDFDPDFTNDGLLDSGEKDDSAHPLTAKAKDVRVLVGDRSPERDEELEAFLDLDDYLSAPKATATPSLQSKRTRFSRPAPVDVTVSNAGNTPNLLTASSQSGPSMASARKSMDTKPQAIMNDPSVESARKVDRQLSPPLRLDASGQTSNAPGINKPGTVQLDNDKDTDYAMFDTKEGEEQSEEQDDLLADFNEWVKETGTVQLG